MNDNINYKVQEFIGPPDLRVQEMYVACAFCGGEVELLLAIEEIEHARLNTVCPGCKRELEEDRKHLRELNKLLGLSEDGEEV